MIQTNQPRLGQAFNLAIECVHKHNRFPECKEFKDEIKETTKYFYRLLEEIDGEVYEENRQNEQSKIAKKGNEEIQW